MRNLLALAIFVFATSAFAQADKTTMYCDYYTPDHSGDIYIDVYFDYDATTDLYTNIEAGILAAETDVYPDYLWTLTATPGNTTATITIEKDADSLSFELPTVAGSATPAYAITKTDGKINGFDITVKGFFMGAAVDQTFSCYDPATKSAPQPVR